MLNTQVGIPVFLQGVDTDLPTRCHVRVENFGQEEGFGGTHWKVFSQGYLDLKNATCVGSPRCEKRVEFNQVHSNNSQERTRSIYVG
jgi:hypothetical protein